MSSTKIDSSNGEKKTYLVIHTLPFDLVSVRLLELLSTDDTFKFSGFSSSSNDGGLHLLLLVRGKSPGRLGGLLLVVTFLVTPLDVLRSGLLEMFLDVMESVLGDVSDSQVGVLLDTSRVGEGLSGEELDEGRLSGSIGTDDSDTGREGDGARDVDELRLLGSRVGVGTVGHLEDGTGLRSDSHEGSGGREGELDDRGGEGVVRLGGGVLFDEAKERFRGGVSFGGQRRRKSARMLTWRGFLGSKQAASFGNGQCWCRRHRGTHCRGRRSWK